jgi:hypothetical protein
MVWFLWQNDLMRTSWQCPQCRLHWKVVASYLNEPYAAAAGTDVTLSLFSLMRTPICLVQIGAEGIYSRGPFETAQLKRVHFVRAPRVTWVHLRQARVGSH